MADDKGKSGFIATAGVILTGLVSITALITWLQTQTNHLPAMQQPPKPTEPTASIQHPSTESIKPQPENPTPSNANPSGTSSFLEALNKARGEDSEQKVSTLQQSEEMIAKISKQEREKLYGPEPNPNARIVSDALSPFWTIRFDFTGKSMNLSAVFDKNQHFTAQSTEYGGEFTITGVWELHGDELKLTTQSINPTDSNDPTNIRVEKDEFSPQLLRQTNGTFVGQSAIGLPATLIPK
jgi:hypothetical protein